jgi:hypothetical protein
LLEGVNGHKGIKMSGMTLIFNQLSRPAFRGTSSIRSARNDRAIHIHFNLLKPIASSQAPRNDRAIHIHFNLLEPIASSQAPRNDRIYIKQLFGR